MEICKHVSCSGCGCCVNICPVNCIAMREDDNGFLYPAIDRQQCIHCDKCRLHCPQNRTIFLDRINTPIVYAAYSKEESILKSSSGGIFSVLAQNILESGGVVYGAYMNSNFEVNHIRIDSVQDLWKIQGSKYVQGNIGMTYKEVKEDLFMERKVLFSGLPCQIGGLYSFLNGDNEKLFTIDVICRGVPSEKVLKKYVNCQEKKANSELLELNFRYKNNSWKPMSFGTVMAENFQNGLRIKTKMSKNWYGIVFQKNIAMRESCYNCHFVGFPRVGDITLGDYAGLGVIRKTNFYNKLGISQVLINSPKGHKLYEGCTGRIEAEERSLDECCFFNLNLWKTSDGHPRRKIFFENLGKKSLKKTLECCFGKKIWFEQFVKGCVILILGERRVLLMMHQKRLRGGIHLIGLVRNMLI